MKINLLKIRGIEEHTNLAVGLINKNIQYFYNDVLITPEIHLRFINSIPNDYLWVIERDGQLCGMVSVYHIDDKNKKCEWGRFVVQSSVKGVGSAVEFMVLDFVFNVLGMNKLYCEVFEDNAHVVQMHEKFGFMVEGRLRNHILKGGRFHDVVSLSMLKSEWEQVRPRFDKIFSDRVGSIER